MKRFLILGTLALAACSNDPFGKLTTKPKATAVTLGTGQTLKAPGVSVLVGPATIDLTNVNNRNEGSFPLLVLDAPSFLKATSFPAISCMVLDDHGRLATTTGGMLPPKLQGADLRFNIPATTTAGSVKCQLGIVEGGRRIVDDDGRSQ
jgi:hypothetical protein